MTNSDRRLQPRPTAYSRVDELLHIIALAMARRQMELAWPTAQRELPV